MDKIKVEVTVKTTPEKAWTAFTNPQHVTEWNFASDDWHSPKAENDLKPGGRFVYRMESKDGAMGFDFGGTFEKVNVNELLSYKMDDGRMAEITFTQDGDSVHVVEIFDPETENSHELQKTGWQLILDNYKKHAESI